MINASECYADNHEVKHKGSNKIAGFGELVETAKTLEVPKEDEVTLKPRGKWRYIGKDAPITDMDDILTGKAIYGIDARMDRSNLR